MSYAPVALFAFRRPEHTRKVIEALQVCKLACKTSLYIYCDGPRNTADLQLVSEVLNVVKNVKGFLSVKVNASNENKGLSKSIVDGVTEIIGFHERVIVLEDDIVTSRYFLDYMNDALNVYEGECSVASVHAYVEPVNDALPETFFIRGADCWGWGTWARAWKIFNKDGRELLTELKRKKLCHAFDIDGSYPYTQMLKDQVLGKNDSWAIRWYASAFLLEMFTLYPYKSLIQNIGLDGSGTHCGKDLLKLSDPIDKPIVVKRIPIQENLSARKSLAKYHKSNKKRKTFFRIFGVIYRRVLNYWAKKQTLCLIR